MHFIKEIFSGKVSKETHKKFIRYGRGQFPGAIITIKKSADFLKIEGSVDYVNVLGRILLKNSNEEFSCSGKIFSKEKLSGLLKRENVEVKKESKKLGTFVYEINGAFSSESLLNVYDELGADSYILLDLNSLKEKNKGKLKTKKKPQKPGSRDEKFFSVTLDASTLPDLVEEVAFDVKNKNFSDLKISHTYLIQELIIPEEYKKNFKEARIHAKRKGKIERVLEVDGVREERRTDLLV